MNDSKPGRNNSPPAWWSAFLFVEFVTSAALLVLIIYGKIHLSELWQWGLLALIMVAMQWHVHMNLRGRRGVADE